MADRDKADTPELWLEKALLNELPAGKDLPAESAARLEALRSDGASILERYPPRRIAAEIDRRRQAERAPRTLWRLAWAPTLAALGLVLFFGLRPRPGVDQGSGPGPGPEPVVDSGDEVMLKGMLPELRVYRSRGAAPERLRDGSAVRPGDVVQLAYLAAGRRAGVIVSIDGRGGTTLHHPAEPTTPTALRRGGEVPLARAYKLDDAPRFERFFFVTAADPAQLDVPQVIASAQKLATTPGAESAPLVLPSGLKQLSLLLRKEGP